MHCVRTKRDASTSGGRRRVGSQLIFFISGLGKGSGLKVNRGKGVIVFTSDLLPVYFRFTSDLFPVISDLLPNISALLLVVSGLFPMPYFFESVCGKGF